MKPGLDKKEPPKPLDGCQKAAILMVLLGDDASSKILQNLEEREILRIGREVAQLGEIAPEQMAPILEEYQARIMRQREVVEGGTSKARKILSRTFEGKRADKLMESIAPEQPESPVNTELLNAFAKLNAVKETDLAQTLELEHPQAAALMLLHMEPPRAAAILAAMNEEAQATVTMRLARLSSVSPDVAREVSEALADRFANQAASNGLEERDGIGAAAEILKNLDRSKTKEIVERLEAIDAECAEILRTKIYTFDMLLLLNDRGMQEVLKGVDPKNLALALKGADEEVANKVFRNMSERAAQMVKDEMEIMSASKLKDIEAAQKEMLDKVLRLEAEGTIEFAVQEEIAVGV